MELVSLMSGLNISDVLFCEHQSTEMVRSQKYMKLIIEIHNPYNQVI